MTFTVTTTTGYAMLLTLHNYNDGTIVTSSNGYSPVKLTYTFASNAQYFIGFGFIGKYMTGNYVLAVSCGSSNGGGTCQLTGRIQKNSSVSGSLGPSDSVCAANKTDYYKVYSFDGIAGMPVRITVSSSFEKYVETHSDGAATMTAQFSDPPEPYYVFYPKSTGTQWLWIGQDRTSPVSGSFTVTINDEPVDPCRRRAARP